MPLPSHFRSKTFRARAEECRTLAESFRDSLTRARMFKVADDYEEMAAAAEALEQGEAERERSAVLSAAVRFPLH